MDNQNQSQPRFFLAVSNLYLYLCVYIMCGIHFIHLSFVMAKPPSLGGLCLSNIFTNTQPYVRVGYSCI